jgi:hypothetical protein
MDPAEQALLYELLDVRVVIETWNPCDACGATGRAGRSSCTECAGTRWLANLCVRGVVHHELLLSHLDPELATDDAGGDPPLPFVLMTARSA